MKIKTPYGRVLHAGHIDSGDARRLAARAIIQSEQYQHLHVESLETGIPLTTLVWMYHVGFERITDKNKDEVIVANPLVDVDWRKNKFDYFLRYEALIMPYSIGYLRSTNIATLIRRHRRNMEWFSPEAWKAEQDAQEMFDKALGQYLKPGGNNGEGSDNQLKVKRDTSD